MKLSLVGNLTNQQKIERIRMQLVKEMPFYGVIACSLGWSVREDLPYPTAATDGFNVYWHPDFLESQDEETLIFTAAHEIHHVIKQHSRRLKLRDHDLFNIACDYQINWELSTNGIKGLRPSMYCNEKYAGMVEEEIYNALLESDPNQKYNGSSGYCLPDNSGKSDGEAQREIDGMIEAAAKVAQAAGKMPGYLQQFVMDNRKPEINWKAQLRNLVMPLFPRSVAWERPNRRLIHSGLYIPGPKLDGTSEIAVLFDTSGSVSDEEAKSLVAELNGIISSVEPSRTQIHWFESYVWRTDILGPGGRITIPDKLSRGGTAFNKAFAAIQGNPKIIIVLTDMGDSFDFPHPKGRVIWVSTTDHVAPWGETIRLKINN